MVQLNDGMQFLEMLRPEDGIVRGSVDKNAIWDEQNIHCHIFVPLNEKTKLIGGLQREKKELARRYC